VMWIAGKKFLISVSSPLELVTVSHTMKVNKESLGTALQVQHALLRSQGFEPVRVRVDPQGALVSL
jgi:hypothetical protein